MQGGHRSVEESHVLLKLLTLHLWQCVGETPGQMIDGHDQIIGMRFNVGLWTRAVTAPISKQWRTQGNIKRFIPPKIASKGQDSKCDKFQIG